MIGKSMNRKFPAIAAAIILIVSILVTVSAYAGDDRLRVPRVAYLEPKDDSVVDLTGKTTLTFRWNSVPMPAGGREAFRFKVYKGFSYDVVVSEDIDQRTFSVDVPADKFIDGETYTWCVKQRDARSMIWGRYDTWSFKVLKK